MTGTSSSDHHGTLGLGAADAVERLRLQGRNELPQERQRTLLRIVMDALREPMLQLLLGAGVIYLFLGDLAEALILLAAAVMSIALVVAQEAGRSAPCRP